MTTGLVERVDVKLPSTKRHPYQAEFVYSIKKRIMVKSGRRGGKTVGAAIKAALAIAPAPAENLELPPLKVTLFCTACPSQPTSSAL